MNHFTRAYDILSTRGVRPLVASSADFLYRTIAPRRILTASLLSQAKILDRSQLLDYARRHTNAEVFRYSSSGSVTVTEPPSYGSLPPRFDDACGTYKYEKPFTAVIGDATILQNGLGTTQDNALILDAANSRRDQIEQYYTTRLDELVSLLRQQRNPSRSTTDYDYDLVCSLIPRPVASTTHSSASSTGVGFAGHVMTLLTSLEGVKRYTERTGNQPLFLYHREPPAYLLEMFELLGFDPNNLVLWDGEPKRVRRLVVPSVRRREHNVSFYQHRKRWPIRYKFVPPEACNWARKTAHGNVSDETRENDFSKRILISRADADRRRIVNRDELEDTLSSRGFETYIPGELSFEEQVELFSQAETVVAPHGAGLANLLFATDCTVVEIFGRKTKPTFFMLSASMGHTYGLVRATERGKDIRVSPSKVVNMLDQLEST